MDFAGIVDIALPVVYVLVGAVLVWFVVELALTIRSTRSTIDDAHKELTPTLKNVEKITAQVDPLIAHVDALVTDQIDPLLTRVNEIAEEAKPAVGRVDPLVERLSLTVDAANLELMRVDQILEDVTQITDSVSKAAGAVDTVTSAPIDLVNSLTGKLRSKFKPRYASDESVSLGAAADASAAAKAGRARRRRRGQRPPRRCQGRQRSQPRTCPRLRRPALRHRRHHRRCGRGQRQRRHRHRRAGRAGRDGPCRPRSRCLAGRLSQRRRGSGRAGPRGEQPLHRSVACT